MRILKDGFLKRLQAKMAEMRIDAFIILNPVSLLYLLGFHGGEIMDGLLLVTKRGFTFFTDARYAGAFGDAPFLVNWTAYDFKGKLALLREYLEKDEAVGIEDTVPVGVLTDIDRAIFPYQVVRQNGQRVVPVKGIVEGMRAIKDADEIRFLQCAGEACDNVMRMVPSLVKPGMTEKAIAAILNAQLREYSGDDELSFPTIVATGPNSAIPHHVPGDRKLGENDILLIDFGATVDHYCGDTTFVFFTGKPDEELLKIFEIVREANDTACRAARPGMKASDLFWVAMNVIKSAGYEDKFTHGLGHGVGLEVHDGLRVNRLATDVTLEVNMSFTIEPGIYLEGLGGVRLERSGVLTEKGFEPFNKFDFTPVYIG